MPGFFSVFATLCCFHGFLRQATALSRGAVWPIDKGTRSLTSRTVLNETLRAVRPSTFDESGLGRAIVVRSLARSEANSLIYDLTPEACQLKPSEADLRRPIAEVMREHPDKDGYCYYAQQNTLTSFCYVSRLWNSLRDFQKFIDYTNLIKPTDRMRTINYDGGVIRTRNHVFAYDDIYCHATGFYSLPRSRITDFPWWQARAISECNQLEEMFGSDLGNYSWTDMGNTTDLESKRLETAMDNVETDLSLGVPTVREMKLHAAAKCAVSREGLGCDMAYCAGFGCILEDGYIGHGDECPALPPAVPALPPAGWSAPRDRALGTSFSDVVRALRDEVVGSATEDLRSYQLSG